MTSVRQSSGHMNRNLFLQWLRTLDNGLNRASLLLLDSCPAHTGIEDGDPETQQPWRHLRIERLPINSTAITQPLDKGIISVFKRKFLEFLSDSVLSKSYGTDQAISN